MDKLLTPLARRVLDALGNTGEIIEWHPQHSGMLPGPAASFVVVFSPDESAARVTVERLSDAERASLLPGETVPDPRRVAELEATREDEVAASDFPTGPEDAEARERARLRREGRRQD